MVPARVSSDSFNDGASMGLSYLFQMLEWDAAPAKLSGLKEAGLRMTSEEASGAMQALREQGVMGQLVRPPMMQAEFSWALKI
eukprot:5053235-Pyramimonas_sp.AAC.1